MAQENQKQKQLITEVMQADEKDGLYQPTISKMEKVQTAVEWLIEQLEQQVYTIDHKDNRVIPKSFDDIIEIKKQAKAMEKEQIEIAFSKSYLIGLAEVNYDDVNKAAEQYYNKTYKK